MRGKEFEALMAAAEETLAEYYADEPAERENLRMHRVDGTTGAQLLVTEVPFGTEYRILNLDGSSSYVIVEETV
ncbi:hypothetical protein SEA_WILLIAMBOONE_189 [Gordonia phage WilliamBoone]|nr:hypothetical protein SEA_WILLIAMBOONE_189 [Gordonia phage WilliamBoone]